MSFDIVLDLKNKKKVLLQSILIPLFIPDLLLMLF